jgi:hypothetical protein
LSYYCSSHCTFRKECIEKVRLHYIIYLFKL